MTEPQDLAGRVFLVTGANVGIGRATAEALARRGGRVHLACRSEDKTRPVLEAIRAAAGERAASFLPLDLADLASVRRSAEQFLATGEPLHVLINNAGLAGQRGLTKDGFELTFGVNHLGHYLFTRLLLGRLRAGAPARIVHVASRSHYRARGIDWEAVRRTTATTTGMREYSVSKLCNLLFSRALERRLAGSGVVSHALHPGVIASDVWRRVPWPVRPLMKVFMRSAEDGARTSIHCAAAPELAERGGRYHTDCREKAPSQLALSDELADELWRRSAEWTQLDPATL